MTWSIYLSLFDGGTVLPLEVKAGLVIVGVLLLALAAGYFYKILNRRE